MHCRCAYTAYSASELHSCFARCGYRRIGFSGDSLGRGHFSSVWQLLSDGKSGLIDGLRFKQFTTNQFVDVNANVSLLWNPELAPGQPAIDVFLFSPGAVLRLFKGDLGHFAVHAHL